MYTFPILLVQLALLLITQISHVRELSLHGDRDCNLYKMYQNVHQWYLIKWRWCHAFYVIMWGNGCYSYIQASHTYMPYISISITNLEVVVTWYGENVFIHVYIYIINYIKNKLQLQTWSFRWLLLPLKSTSSLVLSQRFGKRVVPYSGDTYSSRPADLIISM